MKIDTQSTITFEQLIPIVPRVPTGSHISLNVDTVQVQPGAVCHLPGAPHQPGAHVAPQTQTVEFQVQSTKPVTPAPPFLTQTHQAPTSQMPQAPPPQAPPP